MRAPCIIVGCSASRLWFFESDCLGLQSKTYGVVDQHPKLNIDRRPIANKYREGKMKRTLKRELKAFEIVKREANVTENTLPSYVSFQTICRFIVRLNHDGLKGKSGDVLYGRLMDRHRF